MNFIGQFNQQAVLLLQGEKSQAANDFLSFMKSTMVKDMLKKKYGYFFDREG